MKRFFVEAAIPFMLLMPLRAEAVSFDAIRKYMDEHPVSRLDEVLEPLARSLSRNEQAGVALIYSSLSRQRYSVDPAHPRLVFFTEGFVAAVTGNPSRVEDYERLEIIEQDSQTKAFRFRELGFRDGRPFADPAPSDCARCHGSDPRPIWGSYPLWPGVFGGDGERFSEREAELFSGFRKQMASAEGERYRFFQKKISADQIERAPFELGVQLSRMNAERISERILRSPAYPLYRFALAGAFAGCPSPASFLPAGVRERAEGRLGHDYEGLAAQTQKVRSDDFQRRVDHYNALNGTRLVLRRYRFYSDLDSDSDRSAVAKLRYFLEGQAIDPTLNMPAWSMSVLPGGTSYTYSAGAAALSDLVPARFKERLLQDTMGPDGSGDCTRLRAESLATLANPPES